MACMKDKDAWFIVECLTCPKVMDCIKLDWTDDPKVKEGVVSYLREIYGIYDRFPFLKDHEEKLTIVNFGEDDRVIIGLDSDRYPLYEEKDFEDFMMSRQDGLENKLEDFLRDLTLGDYKEHDICLVRAAIEEIESVLDRHGIKYCDPYMTTGPYNADNKTYIPEYPCFKNCVGPCNKEMCPFRKEKVDGQNETV